MISIYKRELNSYFNSMVGYVFIAIIVAFIGFFFYVYNMDGGHPKFAYMLQNSLYIFLVAVPILTMKSMSEDRKNKSDQILLTAPVSMTGVVMGKYLAMLTVWLIPTILFCFCPLIIASSGTAYLMVDYSTILALFLMVGAQIAVGLFISALTESQVIAAVGTFAVLMVLLLWDSLVGYLPNWLSNVLGLFSFTNTFYNFAYYNLFDIGGLILYLSIAFIFIFATIQTLQKRRWS